MNSDLVISRLEVKGEQPVPHLHHLQELQSALDLELGGRGELVDITAEVDAETPLAHPVDRYCDRIHTADLAPLHLLQNL